MKSRDNDLPLFSAATRPRLWTVAGAQEEQSTPVETPPPPAATTGLELFQGGASDDGYTRWKAEAQAEREAAEKRKHSSELPAAADHQGYETWKTETAELKRAFEHRWGVPLGKPVRLTLRGEYREREGVLRLADDATSAKSTSITLRLGDHTFTATQIESVVRLD
ncbi:MAG TPA: hypothetical protein VGE39_09460 [Prosthecobacter sp.]